jgi:hypothetical protein
MPPLVVVARAAGMLTLTFRTPQTGGRNGVRDNFGAQTLLESHARTSQAAEKKAGFE